MRSDEPPIICTLFEGDYHYGVGALVNSLVATGWTGVLHAGFRGSIPPWARQAIQMDKGWQLAISDKVRIHFVPIETDLHLTNYKPAYMEKLWTWHPHAPAIFYFDPDIVVLARWAFLRDWPSAGIALCQDINGWMPDNHPVRHSWRHLLGSCGMHFPNRIEMYYNCGFVGINARDRTFLLLWQTIIDFISKNGTNLDSLGVDDRTFTFACKDQDALNIACMATHQPMSPVGQQGMDFQHGGGGYIMSHAAGGSKPWRKRMLWSTLVQAIPPTRADKAFFRHVATPIRLFSWVQLVLRRLDLLLASAIGRYM